MYEILDVFPGRNIEAEVPKLDVFPVRHTREKLSKSTKYRGKSTYSHWASIFGAKVRNIEFPEKKGYRVKRGFRNKRLLVAQFPFSPTKIFERRNFANEDGDRKENLLFPPLHLALLKS